MKKRIFEKFNIVKIYEIEDFLLSASLVVVSFSYCLKNGIMKNKNKKDEKNQIKA